MRFVTPFLAIVPVFLMAACGGGASDAPAAPPAVPTATVSAAPATIDSGSMTTLTWSSTNATACTASGGWTGALSTSGTQTTAALTASTTYSLTCSGAGGTSTAAAASVTVNPLPTASLTPATQEIANGATVTLTWTSTGATGCAATGAWTGAQAATGTFTSGALATGTYTYSLTCSGAGGTSAASTSVITVDAAVSVAPPVTPPVTPPPVTPPATAVPTVTLTANPTVVAPGTAAALTWASTNATACTATGAWTGALAANGAQNTANITAATTYSIACTGAGGTSPVTSITVGVSATGALPGVYTYHNDTSRTGTNTNETLLTPANVKAATFGKVAACAVDGAIYAQPLWVPNVSVAGVRHNVVFVATEHNGLFAFDADATPCGAPLWTVSLIDAAHGGSAGEIPVPTTYVGGGQGDITPEIGVTGTPVIDQVNGILYVVSKSVIGTNPNTATYFSRLHAIDITTGAEKVTPVNIAATYPGTGDNATGGNGVVTFKTRDELQRTGLALSPTGILYVAFTAHEDHSPWYGWMMSYSAATLALQNVINVAPNGRKAGIWMSGGAPAFDASNNVYAITGNGTYNAATQDYGDTLLQFTPTLAIKSYFTPQDAPADLANDADFGAGGATLLADLPAGNTVVHALICAGKNGNVFVLNRDMLGSNNANVWVQQFAWGNEIYATGALWNNNFYMAGANGPVKAFTLNPANANFALKAISAHSFGFPGATPSVSANGAQNGIVWALDPTKFCTHGHNTGCGPVVLYAYDAGSGSATAPLTELWNSSTAPADAAGFAIKFTVPTVFNGKVYVGTRGNNTGGVNGTTSVNGELDIYGLR